MDDFHTMLARRAAEHAKAKDAHRFSALRKDYFVRFSRDPDAQPAEDELALDSSWRIVVAERADPLCTLMAGHLREFLEQRMQLALPLETSEPAKLNGLGQAVVLLDSGGGDAGVAESFTIEVGKSQVRIVGRDPQGVRDGIVRMVDTLGFRRAPILTLGKQVYRPRIKTREGAHGSYRDTVFMGYNAVQAGGGSLFAVSTSDAIPELAVRRVPNAFASSYANATAARKYGLKTYFRIDTFHKFPKDDPVFAAHPEIRGSLTWKEDGEYTLCTEHPLVKRYLSESVEQIFRGDPELDGIKIIIGGESFYHCFMRPYGVEKGHTNCERCEAIGAETVVANLCNLMAEAARRVNPEAEVLAWPYSAGHLWSADMAQTGFIERLKPGTAILTEFVKDEVMEKPEGVRKSLWDYSIDLIGPGERAKQQIAACHAAGIPIRVLSMIEETFEASLLPHIPCMDRWADRAEAMTSSGADSVLVFQMGPYDGSSAAEINKFLWWDPAPDQEDLLQRFAARIAGPSAGPHVRNAWRLVSEAIDFSPEIGPYYRGPHYLGPAHPMCADPQAKVPDVFNGYYLFLAEITAKDALEGRPTYLSAPRGNVPVFLRYYEQMEDRLKQAANEMNRARPLVPASCQLMFDAEDLPIQWFYRTARTQANFYASHQLREKLLGATDREEPDLDQANTLYLAWQETLKDEQENTRVAVEIAEQDPRLDCYHRGDHSFSHLTDMLRTKQELLEQELREYLPKVARECGIEP